MKPRGIRNKNPGNIRLSQHQFRGEVTPSTDPQFKQFESLAWGYRAMFLIIHNYNKLYGINTIEGIIGRWAPSSENDTKIYASVVAQRLQRSPDSHVDSLLRETMVAMVWSMSKVENGIAPCIDDIEEGWELFIADMGVK
ncbi:MAG: structural protein P5 [Rikenellaceae bacterium]